MEETAETVSAMSNWLAPASFSMLSRLMLQPELCDVPNINPLASSSPCQDPFGLLIL